MAHLSYVTFTPGKNLTDPTTVTLGSFPYTVTYLGDIPTSRTVNQTAYKATILSDVSITGGFFGQGDGDAAFFMETGTAIYGDLDMIGQGEHYLNNLGLVSGDVTLGNSSDLIDNYGSIGGDVRMGGGDDYFQNFATDTMRGDVAGTLRMGSGDDRVLNAGTLDRVFLGDGNDFYSAVQDDLSSDNYDNPAVFASEVRGGNGNDVMYGGVNNDVFMGGQGRDVLNGHGGNDTLMGGNNKDVLRGGDGNDTLYGDGGKDRLYGGNGDDALFGGTGEDQIDGGRGNDILSGGSGSDVFVFAGNSGADIITDFDAVRDVVSLPAAPLVGGLPAFSDADVLAHLTYTGGNAVLDLSGLYQDLGLGGMSGFSNADGITVTFLDVQPGELTGDNFMTPGDVFLVA